MSGERTRPLSGKLEAYLRNRIISSRNGDGLSRPIEALTFDSVDLSGNLPETRNEYKWLNDLVSGLPEKYTKRKMKEYLNSFPTIDDAVVEKLIMEEL